jgi:hypothetical protein
VDAKHVVDWYSFRNGNDEGYFGGDGIDYCWGGKSGRNIYGCCLGFQDLGSFADGGEDWQVEVGCAAFIGGDAAEDVSAPAAGFDRILSGLDGGHKLLRSMDWGKQVAPLCP